MTKTGKILLVGFGPGSEPHMTLRAREAITESDVVIGYSTYVKLVQDLLDGKTVIRKGMTEELDRCTEAYAHALAGKTVALISSGDAGVYGMAGPTYEVLLQAGWKPGTGIEVEVVPGSTALTGCAALVGAPLSHDFCAISLSDLLTPWTVIARRLEAAARADFVTALYNPKSGRRTQQIVEAQRIFLLHRAPDTPVAIVKSAYRDKQSIQRVDLAHMADCDIGMLSTVLIGNSSTFMREGLMITPRGYANKYDALTGEVRAGERAGRSLSMGLDGWKNCVRMWLHDNAASIEDAAQFFDAPVGDILSACTQNAEHIEHRSIKIADARLPGIAETLAQFSTMDLFAAHAYGYTRIHGGDVQAAQDRLIVANAHMEYALPSAKIASVYLHTHPTQGGHLYLLDASGNGLWRLRIDTQLPAQQDRFATAWATLAV